MVELRIILGRKHVWREREREREREFVLYFPLFELLFPNIGHYH